MEQFGGHKYAAGLKLHESKLKLFRSEFEKFSNKTYQKTKTKTLIYDLEIPLSDLNLKFFKIVEQMEPLGPNNLKPVFCSRNCITTSQNRTVGNDNKHLQLFIKSKIKFIRELHLAEVIY